MMYHFLDLSGPDLWGVRSQGDLGQFKVMLRGCHALFDADAVVKATCDAFCRAEAAQNG